MQRSKGSSIVEGSKGSSSMEGSKSSSTVEGSKYFSSLERRNGRKWNEIRPHFFKSHINSQAKGSGYVEAGGTKIIATIDGPKENSRDSDFNGIDQGSIVVLVKFAPFATKKRSKRARKDQPSDRESELSQLIRDAFRPVICLEKYPKSQIQIAISVLDYDGSLLAVSLLATTLALCDAGIELFDLLIGVSGLVTNSGKILDQNSKEENEEEENEAANSGIILDPNEEEENEVVKLENSGIITIGFMPSLGQISTFLVTGSKIESSKIFPGAVKNLIEICAKLNESMRNSLTKSVKDRMKS